jgi:hypothetical protein
MLPTADGLFGFARAYTSVIERSDHSAVWNAPIPVPHLKSEMWGTRVCEFL